MGMSIKESEDYKKEVIDKIKEKQLMLSALLDVANTIMNKSYVLLENAEEEANFDERYKLKKRSEFCRMFAEELIEKFG